MNFKSPYPPSNWRAIGRKVQKPFIYCCLKRKKNLVLVDFLNPRCKSSASVGFNAGRRRGCRSNGSTRGIGGSRGDFRGSWLFERHVRCVFRFLLLFLSLNFFPNSRVIRFKFILCRGGGERRGLKRGWEGEGKGKIAYLLPSPQRFKTVKEADIFE